jgi:hypothetical protein
MIARVFRLPPLRGKGGMGGWFCLLLLSPLSAAPGGSGFESLSFDDSPRSAAMGGAAVGLGDEASGALKNPAALGNFQRRELSLAHLLLPEGMAHSAAAYAHPLSGDRGGLRFELRSFSSGDIPAYDSTGFRESSYDAKDTLASLAYGRSFRKDLDAGISLKSFSSTIGNDKASTLAADLGILYRPWRKGASSRLGFGAALTNLGSGAAYVREKTDLPRAMTLGMSYRSFTHNRSLVLDVKKPADGAWAPHLGVEAWIQNAVALRAGWRGGEKGAAAATLGAGFRLKTIRLDYAFVFQDEDLGPRHHMGVSFAFGGAGDKSYQEGLALSQKGLNAEAVMKFKQALDADPDHRDALRAMRDAVQSLKLEKQGGKK